MSHVLQYIELKEHNNIESWRHALQLRGNGRHV